MHTLIVTYSPWSSTEGIKELISSIGIADEHRHPSSNIESIIDWHDRFFAKSANTTSPQKVSKAWANAASQIFMANRGNHAWGWCDHRSTWLLDFWLAFDSHVRFMLFYTPLKAVLNRAINDISEDFDIDNVTKTWMAYHAEMLNFYRRHAGRCVFADVESAIHNRQDFGKLVAEKFDLKLHMREPGDADTETMPAVNELAVATYLASRADATSLEQEILAFIASTGNGTRVAGTAASSELVPRVIEEIRNNRRNEAMQGNGARLPVHAPEKRGSDLKSGNMTSAATATKLLAKSRAHSIHDESPQSTLSISSTELNRLEVAARVNAEKDVELTKVRAELDSLIHYSRSIQSEVERNYLEAQQQRILNGTLSRKMESVTRNFPEIVFFDAIKQLEADELRWTIQGLETSHGVVDALDLELTVSGNKPRLAVSLGTGTGQPFADSFVTSTPHKLPDGRIILSPQATVGEPEYVTLRMLSQDELDALDKALYLANRFVLPDRSDARSDIIEKLRKALKELPRTLRFHNVTIESRTLLPAYESLQFVLPETRYGDRYWKTFSFKMAATRARGMLTQPRLEFHLSDAANKPFENWFVESADTLGERLELRFDTNSEIFDAAVWKKLSAVDQLQLLSIISRLPLFLDLIPIYGEGTSPDVSNWKILALTMQKILLKHGLPANTFAVI